MTKKSEHARPQNAKNITHRAPEDRFMDRVVAIVDEEAKRVGYELTAAEHAITADEAEGHARRSGFRFARAKVRALLATRAKLYAEALQQQPEVRPDERFVDADGGVVQDVVQELMKNSARAANVLEHAAKKLDRVISLLATIEMHDFDSATDAQALAAFAYDAIAGLGDGGNGAIRDELAYALATLTGGRTADAAAE